MTKKDLVLTFTLRDKALLTAISMGIETACLLSKTNEDIFMNLTSHPYLIDRNIKINDSKYGICKL